MKKINYLVADKDELLQILDKYGNETGKLINRADAHKKGIYHNEVACIIVNHKKQILLQKRSKNKSSYPDCWGLCAGHVVGYQLIEEAIITEMAELNIEIKNENMFLLVPKIKNERDDNKCFATCFCAVINKEEKDFIYQKEEIQELRWFDISEFKKLVKNEDGTIFTNNQYYKAIITELEKLFNYKNFKNTILDLTELLEEIDKYGNPTGKIVTREFAHNFGIYHKAVSMFVINEKNELLLQKRSKSKIRNGGLWDVAVSGHVRYGEDAKISLFRETEEEIGLKVPTEKIKFLIKYKENRKFNAKFIDNCWFDVYVTRIKDEIKNIKNLEVEDIKFVSVDFLRNMMKTYEELAYKPEAYKAVINYIENNANKDKSVTNKPAAAKCRKV